MINLIFQCASLVIMTFGIVGIPIYLVLNARRKRIASEFETENPLTKSDDTDQED